MSGQEGATCYALRNGAGRYWSPVGSWVNSIAGAKLYGSLRELTDDSRAAQSVAAATVIGVELRVDNPFALVLGMLHPKGRNATRKGA